ncbi:arginyl-tRNA synthetase [Amniculicola lignicola CBS 123094]|uniref:arginine--tRNA ligase n=1 Tax=Amniculicola lignicola CBS 123094 TaxID=1392246 RepID=A0A6A5WD51_9PLEO|nr:arginyl-tRNA synthetase [Amniculicola lignicola CBS 123094]
MATLSLSDLEDLLGKLELSSPIPPHATADVLNKPIDVCRSYLANALCKSIECDPTAAYNSIQLSSNPLHGDFTVVLPRLCPGVKPSEVADALLKKFPPSALFPLPWEDGIHLRLCVQSEAFTPLIIRYINDRKQSYGADSSLGLVEPASPEGGRKKLVVEFSNPNIAEEFQGKHLRSTILGAFVSRMHEHHGWDITKINFLGDWGKPTGLLGVGWERFGSEEAFEQDSVGHLLEVYHKIHEEFLPEQLASKKASEAKKKGTDDGEAQADIEGKGLFAERNAYFKRMEDGDDQAMALFKRVRDVNIENYTNFYARLGVIFDEYSGESQVSQEVMAEIEQALKDKGLYKDIDGAWGVDMKDLGQRSGAALLRNRSGTSTYLLRYLASVLDRYRKVSFDKMIFVAAEKSGHFTRMTKLFEAMDMTDLAGRLQHINFNDVSHMAEKLGEGQIHQPHEILDQCEKAMLNALRADEEKARLLGDSEDTGKIVGIAALLTQELATRFSSSHAFDISSMTTFKTGSGPYLQYWYARLRALLLAHPVPEDLTNEDYASIEGEDQTSLLLLLAEYPEVVSAVYKNLEPSAIMTYLTNLIEHVSDCFEDEEPAGEGYEPQEITPAQSALYETTRQVLENAMNLLGLSLPPGIAELGRVDTPVAD